MSGQQTASDISKKEQTITPKNKLILHENFEYQMV